MRRRDVSVLSVCLLAWLVAPAARGDWSEFLWKEEERPGPEQDEPADPDEAEPVEPGEAEPRPPAGPELDAGKEMFGLDIKKVGEWVHEWHGDAEFGKWEHPKYHFPVFLEASSKQLKNAAALEHGTMGMIVVESRLVKVLEEKKTDKGWYAVVKHDDRHATSLVYARPAGRKTLVVWGRIDNDGRTRVTPIPREEVIRLAESIPMDK